MALAALLSGTPVITPLVTPAVQAQSITSITFQPVPLILPEVLVTSAGARFGSEEVRQKMEIACIDMLKAFKSKEQNYQLRPNDMAEALAWSILRSYLVYTVREQTSDQQDAAMRTWDAGVCP